MSAAERETSRRPNPILLALLGILLVVVAWRYLPTFGGGPGFTRAASGAGDLRSTTIEVVELAAHTHLEPPAPSPPTRDPWSFGIAPPPEVAGPATQAPEPEPAPPPVVERPTAPPARTQPAGPRLPSVDLFYIGSFGRTDDPIAVFIDRDAIYNAFSGDRVKEQFEVQNIGYESVDLLYVDFPDQPPVRLPIGQRPDR